MNTVSKNKKEVPQIAATYAAEIRKRLGEHVKQIILFGSQARGDATDLSDFDFVVVVDNRTRHLREVIVDVGAEVLSETSRLCAALVYGEDQWPRVLATPLGWNIEREGIQL